MTLISRWMSSLTLAPLAVLTLQGVVLNAQAMNDTNAEMKAIAAERAAAPPPVPKPSRPAAQAVYVPATARQLDRFKPVLPPERALGAAMAEAHAVATSNAPLQALAKAEAQGASTRR